MISSMYVHMYVPMCVLYAFTFYCTGSLHQHFLYDAKYQLPVCSCEICLIFSHSKNLRANS